ncbi:hypothetical protein GUJ93_ZPchr0458g22709 [Zizania palustris]|uniref:HMA domain-containing protein n=1 Tax=Zizania palustris TaxID=103762 RepID=A0A8J5UUN6_ZIZPA|nr:hypothetical protein GUJ93_ZPchr0458g22709 [Zizania palustris]
MDVLRTEIHPSLDKVTVVGDVDSRVLVKKLAKVGKVAERDGAAAVGAFGRRRQDKRRKRQRRWRSTRLPVPPPVHHYHRPEPATVAPHYAANATPYYAGGYYAMPPPMPMLRLPPQLRPQLSRFR